VGDRLYTVNVSELKIFDISNASNPVSTTTFYVGNNVETIFPLNQYLFIGSSWGLYIYSIQNPDYPNLLSNTTHVYSCDPVIADSNYAYVTLHSENSWCGRSTNELKILDISDLTYPTLVRTYPMISPKGLGKSGNQLFICDAGLKVFDASDVSNLQQTGSFAIDAVDVIPIDSILLVIGNNGLYQYTINNNQITLLSQINTSN